MRTYLRKLLVLLAGLVAAVPGTSYAAPCRPPCNNTEAVVRPTSIKPAEDFRILGGTYGDATTLNVAGNGARTIELSNFQNGFQIGGQTYFSLYASENGAVSCGAPIPTGFSAAGAPAFQPVASLTELGVPVIAPFYADLRSGAASTAGGIGNVVYQYGRADPYADGGTFEAGDLLPALRITWYGVGAVDTRDAPVFAELILASNGADLNSFSFRYGTEGAPGQAGLGSVAGFAFGDQSFQFTGPYGDGSPTYFQLEDGRVDNLATGAAPEPATWALLILGFGLAGVALRSARPRPAHSARPI